METAKKRLFKRPLGFALLASFLFANGAYSDTPDKLIGEGVARTEENQRAQEKITGVHEQTLSLIEKYEETLKVVEGLNGYNRMMSRQLERQQNDMEELRQSINDVSVVERQIMPLLLRMLDGLGEFIQLDAPFLAVERRQRVDDLLAMMERVDVSVAEKARRVFEAYQIEAEYGRSIESYRDKLPLQGGVYDVDLLRIGRTALLYRVAGSDDIGYWDKPSRTWKPLENSAYRRYFEQGLKVAKREMAPELIVVPVVLEGGR